MPTITAQEPRKQAAEHARDPHARTLRRLRCAYKIVEGLAELTPATKAFVTLGKTIYELSKETGNSDQGAKQSISPEDWSLLQQKIDQILSSIPPLAPMAPTPADRITENLIELSFACPVSAVSFLPHIFYTAVSVSPIKTEDSSYFVAPAWNVALEKIPTLEQILAAQGGQFGFDGRQFSFVFPNGRSRLFTNASQSLFEEGVDVALLPDVNKALEVSQYQDDPRGTINFFAARSEGIKHCGHPSVTVEGLVTTALFVRRGMAANPGDPLHTFYFLAQPETQK